MTLHLRKFEKRDIPDLISWFPTERDALQWAGAGLSWPLNKREFSRLIRQHAGSLPAREVWAVTDGEDMIGHVQLVLNPRLRTIAVGRIALHPAQRGHGLSHRLMQLILMQAFQRDWVHRVELLVYAHNQPAIACYYRAGFTLEGTRRQTTPIGSEIWDTHVMSILRHEFDKRTERE